MSSLRPDGLSVMIGQLALVHLHKFESIFQRGDCIEHRFLDETAKLTRPQAVSTTFSANLFTFEIGSPLDHQSDKAEEDQIDQSDQYNKTYFHLF